MSTRTFPGARRDEVHENAQQRRFAGAGRPDDDDEFAAREAEIEAFENLRAFGPTPIGEADAGKFRYDCHAVSLRRTARNAMSVMA